MNHIDWRIQLELDYALICKFCSRKVIDPDKRNKNQIFTKNKCPHCGLSKNKECKKKIRIAC